MARDRGIRVYRGTGDATGTPLRVIPFGPLLWARAGELVRSRGHFEIRVTDAQPGNGWRRRGASTPVE